MIYRFLLLNCLIFLIISCNEKKVSNFSLTVVTVDKYGESGSSMDPSFRKLCNYIINDSFENVLFVPEVNIVRADFDPVKNETVVVPLSSVNNFRKKLIPISGVNLIEDYDIQIPKLKTPHILTLKSEKEVAFSELSKNYPKAIFIERNEKILRTIDSALNIFARQTIEGISSDYTIVLVNAKGENPIKGSNNIGGQGSTQDKNIPPPPPPPPTSPICQQVTANNIDEFLSMLTTTSIDDCRKENLSKSHNRFFASSAQVVEVDNNGTPIETFQSVTAFVSRIRGKNKIIKIDHANCVKDGNTYLKLSVRMP